jgi:hypothetical protein
VLDQEPVEERLVPVLQRGEADETLERVLLAEDVPVHAPHLRLDAADRVGEEPLEGEGSPLLTREGGPLVEHGVAEEPLAAVRHLDERLPLVILLQPIRFHRSPPVAAAADRCVPCLRMNCAHPGFAPEEVQ